MAAHAQDRPILRIVPAIERNRTESALLPNVVDLDAWAVDRGYKDEADVQMARGLTQVAEALTRLSALGSTHDDPPPK